MRKALTAAIAATLMGMGAISAQASSSPQQGLRDASPYVQANASVANPEAGAELAGLVNAYINGATSAPTSLAASLDSDGNTYGYLGDEAYGVVRASQAGLISNSNVKNFYSSIPAQSFSGTDPVSSATVNFGSGYSGFAAYIAAGALDAAGATTGTYVDNGGLYELSYHVLATNVLGSSYGGGKNGALATGLATALGLYSSSANAGFTESGTPSYDGETEVLALATWALKENGYTGTVGAGGGTYAGDTISGTSGSLEAALIAQLKTEVNTNTYVYSQDAAYGILALQQFADADAQSLVATLKAGLAGAVDPALLGPVPLAYGASQTDPSINRSVQYAGVALQALPEPATLSLIGMGGMALLARRRRSA